MDINIKTISGVSVIEISGDLDGNTAPTAQAEILPQAQPGSKIILDMSGVPYMSSAGLRMLLVTYRQISGNDGQIVLVGLSEELRDTMSVTGFLDFFATHDTVDAGMAALSQ